MPLRDTSPAARRRRRARHFSAWTFVAPAALIVTVVIVVSVITGALDAREQEKQDKARTAAVVAAAQKPGTTTAKANVKPKFHRVKNGESFSSIADRFKTSVDQLTALNPNVDPLKLTPGARIRVQ
jgi:LysM repeat protein